MQIIRSIQEMQQLARREWCDGKRTALVPTMGALHAGHMALVARARAESDVVTASIFVNPTQFGAGEDLSLYPRPFERDCEMLKSAGCDIVFAPDAAQMYGTERPETIHQGSHHAAHAVVEVVKLGDMWEGAVRPGHLRGVATVVCKLFNLTLPQRAYFGEKDFQQWRVIEHMVRDLNFAIEIVAVPTVREADGLALSSRNAYLSPAERNAAPMIYRALQAGVSLARNGERDVAHLGAGMQAICESEPLLKIQYLTIVDDQNLEPLTVLGAVPARILIAARIGQTRVL